MRMVALGAALAAAGSLAAADACPHWISVMPLNGDNLDWIVADAADLGNRTVVDGIAWSFPLNPEGDPVQDKAAVYAARLRAAAPALRGKSSVRQGVLLQSTMGHGGFPGQATPWQLAVKPTGEEVYRMCPLDGRFLDYLEKTCRTMSDCAPDFFMVDDDTRLVWGDVPGCFCPLHLTAAEKATGRAWTREEAVRAWRAGDAAFRAAWTRVQADSLRTFFRTIRANFRREIPGILCVVDTPAHMDLARELAEILAAPGQTPVIRGNGAPYHGYGQDMFHVAAARTLYARQREKLGDGVVLLHEADTCPQTQWACSAVRLYDHLVMLALDGVKGAKIWITRTGNNHEHHTGEAYRRILRENRGLMKWAADADFRQTGVVIPPGSPYATNFGDRYLALTGFPYRFGRASDGEVTALTEESLACLATNELETILSGRVILDGGAALALAKRGYADDLGVTAKKWTGPTVQVHGLEGGIRQHGVNRAALVDLTDRRPETLELTRLYNRPALAGELVHVAPGSLFFENARGGKVLVLAQGLPSQQAAYYEQQMLSETYKRQFARWFARLSGGVPGGVYYGCEGPVTCLSGTAGADGRVVVLNIMGGDDDCRPELVFEKMPSSVERLQGDGTWRSVPFAALPGGVCRLETEVRPQRPAIFRLR